MPGWWRKKRHGWQEGRGVHAGGRRKKERRMVRTEGKPTVGRIEDEHVPNAMDYK